MDEKVKHYLNRAKWLADTMVHLANLFAEEITNAELACKTESEKRQVRGKAIDMIAQVCNALRKKKEAKKYEQVYEDTQLEPGKKLTIRTKDDEKMVYRMKYFKEIGVMVYAEDEEGNRFKIFFPTGEADEYKFFNKIKDVTTLQADNEGKIVFDGVEGRVLKR